MIKNIVSKAMRQPDDFAVEFDYTDAKGVETRRVVSPIRFVSSDRFLALCLCRAEPRQFYLDRCKNARIVPAHDVLMPVDIGSVIGQNMAKLCH